MKPFNIARFALFTIEDIYEIVGGKFFHRNVVHRHIEHLLTDSRKIVNAGASLFFAIKGDRRDGHEFIPDLYAAGVRNFVVRTEQLADDFPDCNFIVSENPLAAMQKVAATHRRKFDIPVIGITGSNGKTIVKEWLYQLLREDHHIVRSPKSYNSQIGVPLSVWQMRTENDLAIFEAGISEPGEMVALEKIIRPTIGLFTNIGTAHDENFRSQEEKIDEKLRLFSRCKTLIYCRDYQVVESQIKKCDFLPPSIKTVTWSRRTKADLQIGRISRIEGATEIQGIWNNSFINIQIPFADDAAIENAINCWLMLLHLGYENDRISRRMELLSPVAMRLELKDGVNNCSIINDSYNSDIGSLTIALDFLNQQKQHPKRTVVLSDILQSGKDEAALYREVAGLIAGKQISRVIGVGPAISKYANLFPAGSLFFNSTEQLLHDYIPDWFKDETLLLKGARTFGFERISKVLQQKSHQTILEINLNALVQNLNFFRSRLQPDTRLMVMVKAFAYGSGSFEIANTLQFHRADYLAVAYADEGVALRKGGISLPIMVMCPEEQSFEVMVRHQLEPEIYSFRILQQFADAVRRLNLQQADNPFPVHIKLDTGMHRLGFEKQDLNELAVRLKNARHLKVVSVFSHLAASDEAPLDGFTKKQANLFNEMADALIAHFNHKIYKHILNSAGILRFPEWQFNMARLGIGLHGIAGSVHEQKHLEFVSSLKTTITQIRNVKSGDAIGYSRKGVLDHDAIIATVGIGYADGYSRKLGNGKGVMIVNGKKCRVVGSVCMDMTMIDVTHADAKEGDEVIVFGSGYSILEMADALETIPYEVLCGISQRVRRIYYHE